MNAIADETLALCVAEATMQDWLAAVLLARGEPMPAPAPRIQLAHPVRRRELPKPARRCPTPIATPRVAPSGVAGARTVYWLSLAAALTLTLVF